MRLRLIRWLAKILLPRSLFVGKHFGGYTQKWDIVFGRLDSRGVLQGVDPKRLTKQEQEGEDS